MMTIKFPKATVQSQAAWTTDFMVDGAWIIKNNIMLKQSFKKSLFSVQVSNKENIIE